MRVLGIDPGLTRCGTAVVDGSPGQTITAPHIGVIRTDPDLSIDLRLAQVALPPPAAGAVSAHSRKS